jgi:hypothetical protein
MRIEREIHATSVVAGVHDSLSSPAFIPSRAHGRWRAENVAILVSNGQLNRVEVLEEGLCVAAACAQFVANRSNRDTPLAPADRRDPPDQLVQGLTVEMQIATRPHSQAQVFQRAPGPRGGWRVEAGRRLQLPVGARPLAVEVEQARQPGLPVAESRRVGPARSVRALGRPNSPVSLAGRRVEDLTPTYGVGGSDLAQHQSVAGVADERRLQPKPADRWIAWLDPLGL